MNRTRAVEPWATRPLEAFVLESGARLVLLMTPSGQVIAQHGFTRAVDVMAAAALGAGIVSSTAEIARMLHEEQFDALSHQGRRHGVFLSGFDSAQGRLVALVVFGPESSLGLVQLFFDGFVRDIREAAPPATSKKPVLAADFERDLNESLTALFRV